MAVEGIFSHWITDDILAMARPNTGTAIEEGLIYTEEKAKAVASVWGTEVIQFLSTFARRWFEE